MIDYLDLAKKAAKEAGEVHKKYFGTKITAKAKSSPFDLVTVADIEAEKRIVAVLRDSCPDHNILAEEEIYPATGSDLTWIIDPLDGTNNFAYGIPIFCVSIALARAKDVILGVVYDVNRDELFCAEKGKGAFLNDRPISVSPIDKLEKSMLATGFYYDRADDMSGTLEWIKKFFLRHITGIRRLGAAALDLSYVGCGRFTGFWEFNLSPWDFAAGKIIIEEAGGKITDRRGQAVDPVKSGFVVASNGKIHATMLDILR
ncbi:MAG: inositol monophosphatase family protein [Candidatus Omnitrophota bacterium]